MKISVIIVDFNSINQTIKYICELHQYISKDFAVEYVLVENSAAWRSTASCSFEVVERSNRRCKYIYKLFVGELTVFLLEARENYGFAIANNIGTEFAREFYNPKYILYSNNDIGFGDTFDLNNLVQIMEKYNDVAIVGPKVIGLDGIQQGPVRCVSYMTGLLLHFFVPESWKKEEEKIENPVSGYVYWLSGCFLLADARKMYEIDMFDEGTFLYAEEMILAERLIKNGWKYYYTDKESIVHFGGVTTSLHFAPYGILREKFNSRCYYYKKYRKIGCIKIFFARVIFETGALLYRLKRDIR